MYKTKTDEMLDNYVPEGSKEKSAEQIAEEARIEAERLEAEKAEQEAEAERLRLEAEGSKSEEEKEAERLAKEANANEEEEETLQTSFSELLKETPATEEKKEVEIPQEVLSEIETYKQKLADYEAQLNDPLVKAVTAGATKEQLIAITRELEGKDYSKSSYKDLIEAEIRSEGFDGEELAEQLEAVMSDFESLLPYQRKKAESELRAKFQSSAKKGESPTLEALDLAYQEKIKSFKTNEQVQEEIKAVAIKEKAAIKDNGKVLVGKKFWGVEFTEETLNDIIEKDYDVNKVADFVNDDGKLDVGSFIEAKFYKRNIAEIVRLAEERGAKKANQGTAGTKVQSTKAPIVHDKKNSKQEVLEGLLPDYIVKNVK